MKTLYGILEQVSVKSKGKFLYWYLKNADFTLELSYNSLGILTPTKCG